MHRFYSTDIKEAEAFLDSEESRHLAKVLRLKAGTEVGVFRGDGKLYLAKVIDASPKKSRLEILKLLKHDQSEWGIHLAVAPTKNLGRWETFLEKATEIGIDRISPILCDNSERKNLKRERQLRIIKSAAKQSHKLRFPSLDEMVSFNEFMKQEQSKKPVFMAHCYEDERKTSLFKASKGIHNALVLIGPEGDFSKKELEIGSTAGCKMVSLSKSRLRTETAAIVATHTLHLRNA